VKPVIEIKPVMRGGKWCRAAVLRIGFTHEILIKLLEE
jgi:hypothetical protein